MTTTTTTTTTLGSSLPVYVIRGLPPATTSVTAVCLATIEAKDFVICGTDCGQLLLWSLDTYRCDHTVNTGYGARVQHLIPTGDHLLCQSKNGVIDAYDPHMSSVQKSWITSDMTFCKCFVYYMPNTDQPIDPKYLGFVSKSDYKLIEIVDYESDKCVATVGRLEVNNGCPSTLFMTQFDGKCNDILVMIGYESGSIVMSRVDPITNQSHCVTQLKCFETIITAMDFNRKIMCGICCSVDNIISVWTLTTTTEDKSDICLSLKKELKTTSSGHLCCGIRSDGRILAVGDSDGRVRVYAAKSLKPLAVLDNHKQGVECLIFSNKLVTKDNKSYLAIGSKDKTISLWDLYNNL